ncbi:hypothetical protein FOZ60_003415 [Perkinsus olseni]|uniref:Cytochrome P450 n=1 Tax=Perkinsus olseni TaxID=32597 RepID=A0A7J6PI54_PEROL|nr:hypothetical protein FOZ60_003415 [Perkinsus olseni]
MDATRYFVSEGVLLLHRLGPYTKKGLPMLLFGLLGLKLSMKLRKLLIRPPFPGPNFLGFMWAALKGPAKLLKFVESSADDYEGVYSVRTPNGPLVVISDPGIGREVLKQRPDTFARWEVPRLLNESNMANAEGDQWRRLRKHGSSSLNEAYVTSLLPVICNEMDKLVETIRLSKHNGTVKWAPGEDLREQALRIVSAGVVSNEDIPRCAKEAFLSNDTQQLVVRLTRELTDCGKSPVPFLYEDRFLWKVLFPTVGRLHRDWRNLCGIIDSTFSARSRRAHSGLSPREAADNILLLWLAGGETVSVTLAWLLYLFCLHPEIQERAREEAQGARDDLLTALQSGKLPFIEACVHETLRVGLPVRPHSRCTRQMHSPAPAIPVFSVKETRIGRKPIPVGTNVLVVVAQSTLKGGVDFRPDRWLTPDGMSIDRDKTSKHLLFGYGRRACPGKDLALKEGIILVAKLLQNFATIRLSPGAKVVPGYSSLVTLAPMGLVLEMRPGQ